MVLDTQLSVLRGNWGGNCEKGRFSGTLIVMQLSRRLTPIPLTAALLTD
jgi:hypothetical protein